MGVERYIDPHRLLLPKNLTPLQNCTIVFLPYPWPSFFSIVYRPRFDLAVVRRGRTGD
jgi:hypothetical protein